MDAGWGCFAVAAPNCLGLSKTDGWDSIRKLNKILIVP